MSETRYGRLTVIGFSHRGKRRSMMYMKCKCDCGKETLTLLNHMRTGHTTSCGCIKNPKGPGSYHYKHGLTCSTEWVIWCRMKQRCVNPKVSEYMSYGGRGIYVHDRWMHSFNEFITDMGPRPRGGTLGRINNDGPYSPENCRWETRVQQANNTRANRRITLDGVTRTLAEWCREFNIRYQAVHHRLSRGWTEQAAITTPLHIVPSPYRGQDIMK